MLTLIVSTLLCAPITAPKASTAGPLVEDAALQELGLKRFWEARMPLSGDDEIIDAHLVDEALYVISRDGRVFALKADVGLLRWGERIAERNHRVFPPRHLRQDGSSGPVVIPTSIGVFIIDRYTGQTKQRFNPTFTISGPAIGFDQKLFVGAADGRFYSLQLDPAGVREPTKRWEVLAGGLVTTSPMFFDGESLLFASQSGSVFAAQAADKTFRWSFKAGAAIEGDLAIDDTGVYAASNDRSLYKLDRTTGDRLWRQRFPSPLKVGPLAAGGLVYQYCQGTGITALDAGTGTEKWRLADGRTLAAHGAAGDVILAENSRLMVVEHETGKLFGEIPAAAGTGAIANTRDDAVYLWGTGGRIMCVRLDDVPYLRRQQVMAAKQDLNQSPDSKRKAEPLPPLPKTDADPNADDPLRSDKDRRPQ